MSLFEVILTVGLALFLLGLAVYFLVRQRPTFHQANTDASLSVEDRSYLLTQARRRVICSILLIVFAGLLVGWLFIAPDLPDADREQANRVLTDQERGLLQFVTFYVIFALLVFFGIMTLATLDFLATARFGHRHQRQLASERKAAIEQDLERWRQFRRERNGDEGR